MAPAKDKWVRRFIIPETTRHKKGFTIYKVTSMVFLKSSHEEISKISVWKRYNDFKRLHSELKSLHLRSQIRESFPEFPKSKFFRRFEAEVIQERRDSALKFLDFIGRHSCLYSSNIFIKFFETSHMDSAHDCSQSLSSDTSEDDRHALANSLHNNNVCGPRDKIQHISKDAEESNRSTTELARSNLANGSLSPKIHGPETLNLTDAHKSISCPSDKINDPKGNVSKEEPASAGMKIKSEDEQSLNIENNNTKKSDSASLQSNISTDCNGTLEESKSIINIHDGSDLPHSWPDSSQYILIAAAHMSAAFRHEAMAEYEEAFTQYKMGISNLLNGVQSDTDTVRAEIIKEKISKYLERAEKLYNRHLNCNVSLLNKPVSELQYYKVLKIMRSVMLVRDLRQDCLRIVKAVEKSCGNREGVSNYILRGQVPYMVRLHACVETESTVFLILDYLSRGNLWDLIVTEYKSSDEKTYRVNRGQGDLKSSFNGSSITLRENGVEHAIKSPDEPILQHEFTSTSPRVQTNDCSVSPEKSSEVYGSDVSTTQLLEKAQILLQSVNATLKESNTVTSRLREYKELLTHPDTASLNLKNATCQQQKWDVILTDVNEISSESHSINRTELQLKVPAVRNSSSFEDIKNDKSPDITDSSSLTDSYTDLSHSEKDSSSYSIDTSKSISVYLPNERETCIKTENIRDLEKSFRTDCTIDENSCVISDEQMHYLLTEYTLNNNLDIEDLELWTIPENLIRLWSAEILLALEALHQQEVIVFDLKPDNILLDDKGHVQLTYITPHQDADLTKYKQPYSSPELCMFLPTIPITTASDIWSFGVILYELIVGDRFQTRHPGLFHSHSIVNIPNKLCENAKSLLTNLLRYEPSERLTIPEIKQHPYFEEIDWASLVNPEV